MAIVHTHTANSQANPEILNPLSRVEIFESDNISDTCGRSNPDILWYDVLTKLAPEFIFLANLNMAADRRKTASVLLGSLGLFPVF